MPVLALAILALTLTLVAPRASVNASTLSDGPRVHAPSKVRIKVQVLNATSTKGLAARATRYLRDRGFDVVEVGNGRNKLTETVVLDRTGKLEWARLVARAFGVASAATELDSTRLVDVTVLIGDDWSPASNPLSP